MAGNRKALIIANDTYEHEALRNLRAPAADADALGRVLGDPEIGDFEVEVVRNQPAHVIQARIEDLLSTAKRDDVVLMHFSCHGLKDVSGALFFAAANTIPDRLGSTTVPAEFVHRYMQRSLSRAVVLLLDCCFGGAFPLGSTIRAAGNVSVLDSFRQERPQSGRGNVVITASSSMEFSLEGDQLVDDNKPVPSFFTAALVEGLASGDADQDEDGWVSVRELYEYVFDKVRERNPNQTPTIQDDLTGKLYISQSRRRLLPGISPGLRAAMNGDRYARRGAISELQLLLAGDDLSAAEGAYEALTQLARDDSHTVVEAASEALKGAAIEAAQTDVRFGRVERGSVPPHQTIRLLGPPIARACTTHPSHGWIHVEEHADGVLDIWADTTGTGALHGTVTVQSPAGQAVITVDIDLFSPPPRASRSAAPNGQPIADSGPRQPSTVGPTSLRDAPTARATPGSSVSHPETATDNRPAAARGPVADRSPGEVPVRGLVPGCSPSTNVRRRRRTRPILAVIGGLAVAVGVAAFIVFGGVIGNSAGESGTFRAELKNPKYVGYSLAFSRDGKTLAVGSSSSDGNNGCTYLWNLATRTISATLAYQSSGGVSATAFSPDGKTLAVGDSSDGGIHLWSLATDKTTANLSNSLSGISAVATVAFSPDGKTLAEGDFNLGGGGNLLGGLYLRLWNLAAGKVTISQTFPGGIITSGLSIAFSPGEGTLAVGDGAGNIYLWSFADNRVAMLFTIPGGSSRVDSVEFSPDGRTLAVADSNGNIYLWSMVAHHIEATLTGPRKNSLTAVAFSPDGTTLATGSSNGSTYLWNVASRRVSATLADSRSKGVNSVTYSGDGTTLAVSDNDGATYVWNITKS